MRAVYSIFKATSLIALCIGLSICRVLAEPGNIPATTGDIVFNDTSASPKTPIERGAVQVGKWLEGMSQTASAGGRGEVSPIGDEAMSYLTVLYLYCTYKTGVCSHILDTILDSDVRASKGRAESAVDCPTMTRFWKTWLASDLEQRSKYLLSLAAATQIGTFNSNIRPRYLHCKNTVSAILKDSATYSARYGVDGSISEAAAQTWKFFQDIKNARIDIFQAVGLSR